MNEAYSIYLCVSWGFPLEVKGREKAVDFSISFSSVCVFVLWAVGSSSTSCALELRPGFAGGRQDAFNHINGTNTVRTPQRNEKWIKCLFYGLR